MGFTPPCRAPENDPDDWFIEKDGRQYDDEELLTDAQRQAIVVEVLAGTTANDPNVLEKTEAAVDEANAEAGRTALARRRRAKDACATECPVRQWCLGDLEDGDHEYGTRGGYYPEERRAMLRLLKRRRSDTVLP